MALVSGGWPGACISIAALCTGTPSAHSRSLTNDPSPRQVNMGPLSGRSEVAARIRGLATGQRPPGTRDARPRAGPSPRPLALVRPSSGHGEPCRSNLKASWARLVRAVGHSGPASAGAASMKAAGGKFPFQGRLGHHDPPGQCEPMRSRSTARSILSQCCTLAGQIALLAVTKLLARLWAPWL